MPELPEVQTIVSDLKKSIIGKKVADFWHDAPKIIKKPKLGNLKKQIKGLKIVKIERLGKNILIYLAADRKLKTKNFILLIHQKLTGHLLRGKWRIFGKKVIPPRGGALDEKVNKYIHFILIFGDGSMLALSDLRKFAKVMFMKESELAGLDEIKKMGPDALDIKLEVFESIVRKSNKKIKQILMDQEKIAGIGNIYSDEILWRAKINPFIRSNKLSGSEIKRLFESIFKILNQALKYRGTSVSDYRDPNGLKGKYGAILKVYQKEGEKCSRCKAIIQRKKIGGRSAHFCPKCQKI